MSTFNPGSYGPAFAPFLEFDRRRPLDGGRPDTTSRSALNQLSVGSAFQPACVSDSDMAACCIAGIWLLHDCLDESHTISQGIDTPSGSFWHAIMHRREGDFSNAKYWFRHTGQYPTFAQLGELAAELAAKRNEEPLARKLVAGGDWDPYAFVDLCQSVASGQTTAREICLDIQQAEWELLFDHCYREAIGS